MQRLISFGCSNTYGVGMSDCWDFKTSLPGPSPSKFAWPQILSQKINRQNINNGVYGASNLQILNNILNFKYEQDDIVIVMWSEEDRDILFTSADTHIKLAHWAEHELVKPYLELHNPYNSIIRSWIAIHHAHLFLKDKGLQFYFVDAYPAYQFYFNRPEYTSNVVSFTKVTMQELVEEYPKALDNIHLGEQGHKELANRLYSEITNEH